MKVKEFYAILRKEPANWERELVVEVHLTAADVERAIRQINDSERSPVAVFEAELSGEPTKEEPRRYALRVKVR